jgi:hypothetical protein
MPDLWDPDPDVSAADEQPDPAPVAVTTAPGR